MVDLGQVIDFFNNAATDLPDQTTLKGRKLPSLSVVLDGSGKDFADVFEPGNRRIWVPLADVPDQVQKAFIAAEDRRFYQHHGVDERGIIRAFIGDLAEPGRPQGGSTITQQVVKNLLVGEDVTYERKIREMIVASRLENTLSKNDILELYLNSAYLGRASWGVEMAARSYFGKSAKDLTLGEGAMLAGLLKGPNYYNPDRHPDRAKDRLTYVLDRMQEDGVITAAQKNQALASPPKLDRVYPSAPRQRLSFRRFPRPRGQGRRRRQPDRRLLHGALDHQCAIAARHRSGAAGGLGALRNFDRPRPVSRPGSEYRRRGAETRSRQQVGAAGVAAGAAGRTPAALRRALDAGGGFAEGRQIRRRRDPRRPARRPYRAADGLVGHDQTRSLSLYDVVYVNVIEPKVRRPQEGCKSQEQHQQTPTAQAQLRVRPTVEGAALVLENKTGRILAMAGSFSYPLSQLNRTAQTQRQPGSAMKPVTYLTALQHGLQPNTLILNEPITFPPIGSHIDGRDVISREFGGNAREEDYWSPRNADYSEGGAYTLRRGLENSINVITAHLLDGGIDAQPEKSLDDICATAIAAKIYPECVRYYPFILGAQPVKMIDLAAFYAAVANEGALPQPHGIDSIEQDGRTIYQYPNTPLPRIGAADPAAFYQLKTILQGVVARGTARAIASLSPYVAGKTGTTEDAVDGWFIGFTNDVTVAVWVGYDNGNGKRRSLGPSEDGARVALPIFQPIIQAVWADNVAPKAPLSGPSPQARRDLVDIPIDYMSGNRMNGGNFIEHFRRAADGQVADTQYQLVSQDDAYAYQGGELQSVLGWRRR